MNSEDDYLFVKIKPKGYQGSPSGSEDYSAALSHEMQVNPDENQPNRSETSCYEDLKRSDFLNISASSIIPIQDGSVTRRMPSDGDPAGSTTVAKDMPVIQHVWRDNPTITRFRGNGGTSAASVNNANTSAVIHRRQDRQRRRGTRSPNLKNLRLVLSILYYAGLSPYRPQTSWVPPKSLERIIKIVYWGFVCIAMLESGANLKIQWIDFRLEPKVLTIAETGISLLFLLARIYFVKVFATMNQKMDLLLERVPETRSGPKLKGVTGFVLVLSICMSITTVVFGSVPLKTWSFVKQQRIVAYETNECIAIWTPTNWTSVTNQLYQNHLDGLSAPTVLFAVIGDTVNFIGSIYDNFMVDFWLALSYQVYHMQADLQSFLKMAESVPNEVDFDTGWNLYMESRIACDSIDGIFGPLLKLVHVTNILRLSEFLVDMVKYPVSGLRVTNFIVLTKIAVTYSFCLLSAETNPKMQEQVVNRTDTNGCITIDGVKLKVYALRKDMKLHQLGIGRGNFLVEETFLLKMVCAAWSVFALIADHSTDPD